MRCLATASWAPAAPAGMRDARPCPLASPCTLPNACSLVLVASNLTGPLPDVQPGALPLLQHLLVHVPELRATLPASWGAAGVLPSLRRLDITLRLSGGLPADWARGFRRLEKLAISCSPWAAHQMWMDGGSPAEGQWPEAVPHAVAAPGVPDAWATPGSFPRLTELHLGRLGLSGSLPRALAEGAWPALEDV